MTENSSVDVLVNSITAIRSVIDNQAHLPADWLTWFQSPRVILTGVGKSVDVARLGSSVLQSVGLATQAIHATELLHGGFGVFYPGSSSTLVFISHSGRTREVIDVKAHINNLRKHGRVIRTVAITAALSDNLLATQAQHVLHYTCDVDGSTHGTIPTVSTTAQLAWLNVVACAQADLLTRDQLALSHPAGDLATIYERMSSG